jgi:hypothetical protein
MQLALDPSFQRSHTLLPEISQPRQRRFYRRRELMSRCLEYVLRRTRDGNEPVVSEIQRYMLREYGITREQTSLILRDLADIGMIGSRSDLRIFSRADSQ